MNRIKIIEKKSVKKILEKKILEKKILEELYCLEKEGFGKSAYSYEQLKEMFNGECYNFYIANYEGNSEIVGYLITYDSLDAFEIIKIFVRQEERKIGLGSSLIKFFIDNRANKDVFLEVRESNHEAVKFYENKKFEKISIRKKYYKDNDENALIMKLKT